MTSDSDAGDRRGSVTRTRRLVIGAGVLVLVNLILVMCAEMNRVGCCLACGHAYWTQYLFDDDHLNRPFFTAYAQCTMFTLYLLGFLSHRPWRDQCLHPSLVVDDFDEVVDESVSLSNLVRSL